MANNPDDLVLTGPTFQQKTIDNLVITPTGPGAVQTTLGALVGVGNTGAIVRVALTSAQILAANATPITLVAAPGAGLAVVVNAVTYNLVAGGAQYATGTAGGLYYGTSAGQAIDTHGVTTLNSAASSAAIYLPLVANVAVASVVNQPVVFTATAAFTTGTGTASINVDYIIVTL